MMRVLIRVDSSIFLGAGHVARCVALAVELKRRDHQVVFVMRALPGHLIAETKAQDFEVLSLTDSSLATATNQAAWIEMARAPSAQLLDAKETLNTLQHQCFDWVVVDHYALGIEWQNAVRGIARKLLAVDDEANRPIQCDALLNQNLGATAARYRDVMPPHCLALLGPRWALLRPEFSFLKEPIHAQDLTPGSSHVLVSLGGADAQGYALQVLEVLGECGFRSDTVTVVAGARNPHALALAQQCHALGFAFLNSTQAMAQLMARSDWAIGAGGVSLLERCTMGLPSITLPIAPNQWPGVQAADAHGAVIAVNPEAPSFRERLRQAIQIMQTSAERLKKMALVGRAVCDANGARRVVDVLQTSALTLRQATLEDATALHEWRNAPQTRRHSGNGHIISFEQHHAWLQAVLNNAERRLWIASIEAGPVGVLRFDRHQPSVDAVVEISVYRVPSQPGTRWGRALIARGVQEAQMTWPSLQRIDARISSDNLSSLKAFAACGFEETALPGVYQKTLQKISL